MERHLWLSMIWLLILALGVFPFSSQATIESMKGIGIPSPPLPFRMVFQGFTNESPWRLVIRQGETGILRILFTRRYSNETLSMRLWLDADDGNMPEGISYAINPYLLELSTDADYSVNLTIVASPNARVGSFVVGLGGLFYPSRTGIGLTEFGQGFTLEIRPATGWCDLNGDGVVNIQDITIVAAAYGSIPGSLNWNELADLDKNGTINILDVTMVAKDYGNRSILDSFSRS